MSEHQKPDTLTNLILRIAVVWRGIFAVVAVLIFVWWDYNLITTLYRYGTDGVADWGGVLLWQLRPATCVLALGALWWVAGWIRSGA